MQNDNVKKLNENWVDSEYPGMLVGVWFLTPDKRQGVIIGMPQDRLYIVNFMEKNPWQKKLVPISAMLEWEFFPDKETLEISQDKNKVYKWTKKIIGHEALSLLSGENYGGEINVICPYCQGDYTHIKSVSTLKGSDEHEAVDAYAGTSTGGTTGSRRSALQIVVRCEVCPNPFALIIQQHKGINGIEIGVM